MTETAETAKSVYDPRDEDQPRLTEVVPGAQDDDDGVLSLQSLLHVVFIQNVSHHHSGRLMVGRQLGRIAHQHRHVIS